MDTPELIHIHTPLSLGNIRRGKMGIILSEIISQSRTCFFSIYSLSRKQQVLLG